jgi:dihydrofolate synthase/folylpolyglutamate synthase
MASISPTERRRAALDFLLGRIDYERSVAVPYGEREYRLDRMRELLERLDRPDRRYPIVHVAGTKGKGSTAAMAAAALSACGLTTGLYTSPHLEHLEERFCVDGVPCDGDELATLVEQLKPVVAAMDDEAHRRSPAESGPTYFELTTAIALLLFARRECDAAVLEVGMGGRLDSTNVCQATVSVITSISYDHTKQLGETLAEIAWEKAGIIKAGVPVVSGVTGHEARAVVERVAKERGGRLVQRSREFDFAYRPPAHLEREPSRGELDFTLDDGMRRAVWNGVQLGLAGRHQAANAATALAVVEELRRLGWNLGESDVRRGLAELHWPARVQVIARRPCVVLDAAHNTASIEALLTTLEESFTVRRKFLLFATTQEKDVGGMLRLLLPKFDRVVLTRYAQNPRGVPVETLAAIATMTHYDNWQTAADPSEAWDAVHRLSPSADDLVCITGSFFIAAQVQKLEKTRPLRIS